jgi:iron complex transport system substrate-binding protein
VFRFVLFVAAFAALFVVSPAGAAVPHRIVSLSPTATETLFAIGAGKQVVAVDDQSDYPKRAPRTSLSGFTPNVEAIASYRPDLVVLANDLNDVVPGLRRLGIRVLVQPAAKNLAGTYAEIKQLGKVTGHSRAALALVNRMKAAIKRTLASTPKRRFSVYHELTPDYYSATSKTFIGTIYKLFGLRNIADAADSTSSGYPQLSGEYILSANPNLIVGIDDSVASRWGPRVVQFVQAVGKALRKR